jgi:DNA-binding NarL/FixJ family response regulator
VSANPTSVVVIHPEALCAEAIAVALSRYAGLVPVGTATTAVAGRRLAGRADAVVMHASTSDAGRWARRLEAEGARVVLVGEGSDAQGARTRLAGDATIPELASRLRPGSGLPEETLPGLTQRERQVMTLVAGGLAGKQVAHRLGISPKTVERHKTRIYSKLGVPNQAAAAGIVAIDTYRNGGSAWSRSTT